MSLGKKTRFILKSSGKTGADLAAVKGKKVNSTYNHLYQGITTIEDLLIICKLANWNVTLVNKEQGVTIPLSLEDIIEDEEYFAKRDSNPKRFGPRLKSVKV